MNQNQPIIVADKNPEKLTLAFGKTLKIIRRASIIAIVAGLIFTICGFNMLDSLKPYSDDLEEIGAMGAFSLGILGILAGILCPLFLKKAVLNGAKSQELRIFEDHIEGKGTYISGTAQTLMSFSETYSKIESVSTTETHISFNMKNGNAIRCVALNAQEMSDYVRNKLN